jgi:chorismate mutase
MADAKADAATALEAHRQSIDDLHQKLMALPGCDKARLAQAVAKYKAANQVFHDDALACVAI